MTLDRFLQILRAINEWLKGDDPPAPIEPPESPVPPAPQDEGFDVEALLQAATLARKFEGLFLTPYLCPAGVPTIGFGCTYYENGLRVSLKDPPITKERAEQLLQFSLRCDLKDTLKLCAVLQTWGADSTGAIMDFVFNLGASRLSASTLRKRINANDVAGAKNELMKWTYGAGRRLNGLVLRRAAEVALLPR